MRLHTLAAAAVVVTVSLGSAEPTLAKQGEHRGRDKAADAAHPADARPQATEEDEARRQEAEARREEARARREEARARREEAKAQRQDAKTLRRQARAGGEEARTRRAEAQARRKARFVAVGTVTAASTDTITLLVKGGSARNLRGRSQAFTVPAGASVIRNGEKVPLSAIQSGDHAMVKGTRTDTSYTASKIRAQSRGAKPAKPSTTSSTSSTSSTSTTTTVP